MFNWHQKDQEGKGTGWLEAAQVLLKREKVVGRWAGREEALYAHGPPAGRVWEWAFAPDP